MAPDDEPEVNPYAPPTGERAADEPARDTASEFEAERRSVLACLGLMVVTLGVYQGVWLWRRQPFLDGLGAPQKLGKVMPGILLACYPLAFLAGLLQISRDGDRVLTIVMGIASLMAVFRGASILRSTFRATGRRINVSYGMTFFFGTLYLQHLINRAAATPAQIDVRRGTLEKKRKQVARRAEADPET